MVRAADENRACTPSPADLDGDHEPSDGSLSGDRASGAPDALS